MAGLLVLLAAAVVAPAPSSAAQLAIGISVRIAPPPLPVYDQPICPGPGYIWTPGYWAYDPENGYYWVPGTWVLAPALGLLWTPGYWGWSDGVFIWHAGYWGPRVGFYGGINYGFGYIGVGYVGGYWRGGVFFYNRAVNHINEVTITHVYSRAVVNNVGVARVCFNGGPGGISARPTPAELAAEHDRHIAASRLQLQHQESAHQNRAQFVSVNHGRPDVVATVRPGAFQGKGAGRVGGVQRSEPRGPNRSGQNNASKPRSPNPGGGGAHPYSTASSPSPRGGAKAEGRTASGQSSRRRSENAQVATPKQKASRPRPEAQKAGPKPAEGEKPERRGPEPRR